MKKVFTYLVLLLILFFLIIDSIYFQFFRTIFESFSFYLFPNNNDGKGELFKIILSVFGGVAVIYGLYVSLRRAKAMEKGVAIQGESIDNQNKQLELSRKSQIDERFKNAIEHLGSDKEPIILGGIAELHQIAKENKVTYAEVVFNILCSYIRTSADVFNKKADEINHKAIQTIVNYLFKKGPNNNTYDHLTGNLSYTNLLGVDLTDCNFKNFNLSSCYLWNLNNSDLSNCKLSGSILRTSKLINVDMTESDLFQVVFHYCEIKDSLLTKAKVSKTIFLECTIENVKFDNICFHDVNFSASYLNKLSLKNCSIISGKFCCAHLENLDFSNLDLFGSCDFRSTSFHNVTFRNIITSSNFNGANYEVNEYPQLYDRRLKERKGKKCEVVISDIEYGKNITNTLSEVDCIEITESIKALEKIEIKKHVVKK